MPIVITLFALSITFLEMLYLSFSRCTLSLLGPVLLTTCVVGYVRGKRVSSKSQAVLMGGRAGVWCGAVPSTILGILLLLGDGGESRSIADWSVFLGMIMLFVGIQCVLAVICGMIAAYIGLTRRPTKSNTVNPSCPH